MEKWARSLSKPMALLFGFLGIGVGILAFLFLGGIIGGAIAGGAIGFSAVFFMKGITGMTPQERKEAKTSAKNDF